MARPLLMSSRLTTTVSQAGLTAMTLLLCAFALFMCASHSRKWRRHWRACYGYGYDEPVIQLNSTHEGIIQFASGEGSEFSGEVSVWQKNILMGGKCQLPDFSGVIIYDSEGNIVSQAKPTRALTWK